MVKISIVGMGRVGSSLAYELIKNPKIEELFVYDVIENRTKGAILDISHAYPELSYKLKIGDLSNTASSKIIIITAGIPRTPEIKTREDLLSVNKKIIIDILKSIKIEKDTILLITTNPVEHITYMAYKLSGHDAEKLIGFSNYLDSQRFRYIISKHFGVNAENAGCIVIGEHDDDMIPLFSQCTINGERIEISEQEQEKITKELIVAGKEIIDLSGGTQFGPVGNIEKIVESILNDSNEVFSLSFFCKENFYYADDVCVSLPVKIGKDGVNEIIKLNLSNKEKEQLKNVVEKLKKVQNTLA